MRKRHKKREQRGKRRREQEIRRIMHDLLCKGDPTSEEVLQEMICDHPGIAEGLDLK